MGEPTEVVVWARGDGRRRRSKIGQQIGQQIGRSQIGQQIGQRDGEAAGGEVAFRARVRVDTPREAEYFRHGGILQYVLRALLAQ
jgi:aconitase A